MACQILNLKKIYRVGFTNELVKEDNSTQPASHRQEFHADIVLALRPITGRLKLRLEARLMVLYPFGRRRRPRKFDTFCHPLVSFPFIFALALCTLVDAKHNLSVRPSVRPSVRSENNHFSRLINVGVDRFIYLPVF